MTTSPVPGLPVNEIRDYRRVNTELARLLDAGARHVRLLGVEGQRLLASDLVGAWSAVVEIDGPAGPEFAAGMDAPGLVLVVPAVADGAARGLKAGHVVIVDRAGDGLAYEMAGGVVVASGSIGHRPGLRMSGGRLLLLGPTGRLVGDRQSGGLILARNPGPRHGQTGGELRGLDATSAEFNEAMAPLRGLAASGILPESFRLDDGGNAP